MPSDNIDMLQTVANGLDSDRVEMIITLISDIAALD